MGGLTGRQIETAAVSRFAGEPQVVVGLINAAGNGKVVGDAPRGHALAVDLGHGHLYSGPAIT